MRYGVALPNYGPLATPENLVRLARRAEELGADSVWVSDHVIVPERSESAYPYDRRAQPAPAKLQNLEQFYDAFTTLAFIAGATTHIRLGVSVYVVPLRNPIVTAMTVASLDALSNGRVIFGVGVGWLREEFEILHAAPFAQRGRVTDEYLRLCKAVWTDEVTRAEGAHYTAPPFRAGPKPVQQPHPPIWVGGNGEAALKRVVRLGDGWHPIDLTPDEIRTRVGQLHELCAAAQRDPTTLTISLRRTLRLLNNDAMRDDWLVGTSTALRADIAAYARAGVDYLVLNLRHVRDIDDMLAQLERIPGLFE